MFKKVLKISASYVVGSIFGLIIIVCVLGAQVAINAIIPVIVGVCCTFIVALYFASKEDNDKDK